MRNIILVGAGQLGSRHLQALALLETPYAIWVVDPSVESLDRARSLYQQVEAGSEHRLYLQPDIDGISQVDFDHAIIATSANVRYEVLSKLADRFNIKNVLFEKILFQAPDHYTRAQAILDSKGIKAWVNCPRRMYYFYQWFKSGYLDPGQPVRMEFTAGEHVGLACNAIHYLDILNYLCGELPGKVLVDGLNEEIVSSKRSGFIEFTGELICQLERGSVLAFNAIKNSNESFKTRILHASLELRLDEMSREFEIFRDGDLIEQGIMEVPYQSNLTNKVIDQIDATGSCELTEYSTSAALHLPYIEALLKFYNETRASDEASLRIT